MMNTRDSRFVIRRKTLPSVGAGNPSLAVGDVAPDRRYAPHGMYQRRSHVGSMVTCTVAFELADTND